MEAASAAITVSVATAVKRLKGLANPVDLKPAQKIFEDSRQGSATSSAREFELEKDIAADHSDVEGIKSAYETMESAVFEGQRDMTTEKLKAIGAGNRVDSETQVRRRKQLELQARSR